MANRALLKGFGRPRSVGSAKLAASSSGGAAWRPRPEVAAQRESARGSRLKAARSRPLALQFGGLRTVAATGHGMCSLSLSVLFVFIVVR